MDLFELVVTQLLKENSSIWKFAQLPKEDAREEAEEQIDGMGNTEFLRYLSDALEEIRVS